MAESVFGGLHTGLIQTLESAFPTGEGWAVATLDKRASKHGGSDTAGQTDPQKASLKRALSNDSGSDESTGAGGDGIQGLVMRTSVYLQLDPVLVDPEDGSDLANGSGSGGDENEFNESTDNLPKEAENFAEFGEKHFHNGHTAGFTKDIIKSSLLPHEEVNDRLAALGIWVNVIKFMGEIPEPMFSPPTSPRISSSSIMSRLYRNLPRKMPENHEAVYSEGLQTLSLEMTAPSQAGQETMQDVCDRVLAELPHEVKTNPICSLPLLRSSKMEKIHYIIGTGILRPSLRDEIYCQLCKQLTANPTSRSRAYGWILLSLCASCFPPGNTMSRILRKFVDDSDSDYKEQCGQRLERVTANGARTQPPSWLEFQAIKCQAPITVDVTFMDGERRQFEADAAVTAHELCDIIAARLGLNDHFGFSLYITMDDKVSSLQNSDDHVMDAISQCEQTVVKRGGQEHSAPWRLFFRKEIFKPWYDVTDDAVEVDLIYQQVIKGVKYGEYKCDVETDLATIVAQHYFVLHGANLEKDKLKAVIKSTVHSKWIKNSQSMKEWQKKVDNAFKYNHLVHEKQTALAFKQNVVTFAKEKWCNAFSRFFEGRKVAGPELLTNDVIVAINSNGLYLISDKNGILVEMIFCDIKTFGCNEEGPTLTNFRTFTVTLVTGTDYQVSSPNASDIIKLLTLFMDGLKSRSKYVMAIIDVSEDDELETLALKKGDILELDECYSAQTANSSVLNGSSERTGCHGKFTLDDVMVLSVIDRPDDNTIKRLKDNIDYKEPL